MECSQNIPTTTIMAVSNDLPMSLASFKDHARVIGTAEDTIIGSYLRAAATLIEGFTNRAFLVQTYHQSMRWFGGREIILRRSPAATITSIKYNDANGAQQTFDLTKVSLCAASEPSVVRLKQGEGWPDTDLSSGNVQITYTAGYASEATIPDGLKQCLRFLALHFYENKIPVQSLSQATVPLTFISVINNQRADLSFMR